MQRRLGSPVEGGEQADCRVGQSVRANAGAGVAEGTSADPRAKAAVGAATDAEAADEAGVAAGVGVADGTSERVDASAGRRTCPSGNGRRCDADETPKSSEAYDRSCNSDLDDDPPPEFDAELAPRRDNGSPPSPIFQPDVSANEVRLPVGQFKDDIADLPMYACAVQHDLTQASISDLLKLSSTTAKYRTPYLTERFINARVNLETRDVDCCVNGCLTFTHKRAQLTACDACAVHRYKSNEKAAKQVTYWLLTSWLAQLLGDPVIGKSNLENMAAARQAANDETDVVHDYSNSFNFRLYRDRKLLDDGPFVLLNLRTDGFEFFRQNGIEGWPVTATPLSMSPEERTRSKHQLLLVVTAGPRQPVGLESFLHPIAEELNDLAEGFPGLIVPISATPVVLRAGMLNFNMDQPGGDKLANFKGASSYVYNRLRLFKGVYVSTSSHIYYPAKYPSNESILFEVHDCTVPCRSAAGISASAAEVEHARASGRSVAFQTRLEQESGVKGYSLFFAPSPEARAAYPHLQHLWDIGPTAAPYDTMYLVLPNVVPHLWKLFAGLKLVNKKKKEKYIIPVLLWR